MNAANKRTSNGNEVKRGGGAIAGLLLIFTILMVANFSYSVYQSSIDEKRFNAADELRVLSQQISNNASEAVDGNVNAFDFLAVTRNNFERNFILLQSSLNETDFKFTSKDNVTVALQNTNTLWNKVKSNADTILESRNTVLDLHDIILQFAKAVPQLQELSEEVATSLIRNGGTSTQIRHAASQAWYAERLIGSAQKLVGGIDAKASAADFELNVKNLGSVIAGMLNGNNQLGIRKVNSASIRLKLNQIAQIYDNILTSSDRFMKSTSSIMKVHKASDLIFADASKMLELTDNLSKVFVESKNSRLPGNPLLSAALLIVVVVLLVMLYVQQRRNEQQQLKFTGEVANREKEQNETNQEAIIRLLDEMEGLADGDLTAHATVTEDFTGAIADAMNYTIDQLRSLVSAINNTVVQVSQSSDETLATASELAQASRNQAQEIHDASTAISDMATSIEDVSTNANETSEMAQESVAIAKSGGDIVRNSIRAMDTIREQIQETSKRIKRLGESSQEIGDIVALINDISDQTNILALNAAIQATMAGEAGRGFAVVSDEVQRLAERSGNAAKQIEGLVKTIQTDTNQAVISMESSTSEVVSGARLAQDAGVALERIEKVSNDVAGLITHISETARNQAASAGQVTETMMVIQDITTNTAAGTEKTAESIGNLADLADELKASVAGFKLPE